jgi:hypothetical protein
MKAIKIPVSLGELVDKITILEIKQERITDAVKLVNVVHELELLRSVLENLPPTNVDYSLMVELKDINRTQWDVEEKLRMHEANGDFGPSFVNLARSAYRTNDRRMNVKRKINELSGSKIQEEKSHMGHKKP